MSSTLQHGCADLSPTALRAAGPSVAHFLLLRSTRFALSAALTLRSTHFALSDALTLRSTRFALSAVEFFAETRLRRPCLDRFAVFAKASRIFIENAERLQAARSAACPFNCAGEICKPRSGVKSSTPLLSLYPQNGCTCERVEELRRNDTQSASTGSG